MKSPLLLTLLCMASCDNFHVKSISKVQARAVLDSEISAMQSRLNILRDAESSTFIDTLKSSASVRNEFDRINEIDSISKLCAEDTSATTKYKIDKLRLILDSLNIVEMPYLRSVYSLVKSAELTAKYGYDINASLPAWYQSGKRIIYERKDPNGSTSIYSMPYNDNLFLQSGGFIQPPICEKIYSELALDFKIYRFKKVYFQTRFDMHSVVAVYRIDSTGVFKL